MESFPQYVSFVKMLENQVEQVEQSHVRLLAFVKQKILQLAYSSNSLQSSSSLIARISLINPGLHFFHQ